MKVRFLFSCWMAAALSAAGCTTISHGNHKPLVHKTHNLPPAQQLMEPGPGVGGPGPGVLAPATPPAGVMPMPRPDVQLLFVRPEAMQVRWDTTGQGMFDSEPLVCPGRHNFPQDGIYRLKVTNIGGREGVELYPTVEVGPTTPRSEAFLAHNAIPIQFTDEDFDQVLAGNFVTKVIYLPDPEFQELALAGVETLVSTKLDPGVDPITEADRRGTILGVVRLGNKDVELPGGSGDNFYLQSSLGGGAMGAGGACADGSCGHAGCGRGNYGGPGYGPPGMSPGGIPPQFVAGVTAPQYGMTMSGTPIGLPGPPHIPLGGPAGLQKHVIKNHTHTHIPEPTEKLKIHVKQQPGYSYPRPPSRAFIREQSIQPSMHYAQPHHDQSRSVRTGGTANPPFKGQGHPTTGFAGSDCENCQ